MTEHSAIENAGHHVIRTAKRILLFILSALGLPLLARSATRRGLRILCYHGIALADESRFQPKLFMRAKTFRARMHFLKTRGFTVLPLTRALELLYANALPANAVAITFDDGWLGTYALALPILEDHGYPATIYVTTGAVVSEDGVFAVFLRYLLWLGQARKLDTSVLVGGARVQFDLGSAEQRESAATILSGHERADKKAILRALADHLGLDYQAIARTGMCRLMTREQISLLKGTRIEVQLHTHSHSLSMSEPALVESEIRENRRVLQELTETPLVHFCYPSGAYHPRVWPWLKDLGIHSATTCRPGFNYPSTSCYELRRFLDGENISQVEFEAEVNGVLEILRGLRSRLLRDRMPLANSRLEH